VTTEFKLTHRQLFSDLVERLHVVEEYADLVATHAPVRQMIGIQNNHYRARGVRERRYALPASMISSKSGSFLNLPASRFHHGSWDVFRTAFSSDLIFLNSRSRTVTRRSNFVAVDCIVPPVCRKEYIKWKREESPPQSGGGLGKLGETPEGRALSPPLTPTSGRLLSWWGMGSEKHLGGVIRDRQIRGQTVWLHG
jgi:hypothetical protein